MWKIFDIRDAETNQYLGTVETETPMDAAIIHFSVDNIKIAQILVVQEDPFEIEIEDRRFKIIEDKAEN